MNAFLNALKRFTANSRGTLAVAIAASAPALLGVVALATDYVMMTRLESSLQTAADAAALGSASEMGLSGSSDDKIRAVALSLLKQNLSSVVGSRSFGEGNDHEAQGVAVEVDRQNGTITVKIEEHWHPTFLQLFSSAVTPIHVRSQAKILASELICVLGLSESNPPAVHLMKNARLTGEECTVYSNNHSSQGIRVDDNARLIAATSCVVGGYRLMGHGTINPLPTTDCPPLDDPLAQRPPPPISACSETNLVVNNQTRTLDPGTYCGGLTIKGNSQVTLNPGVYVIQDGQFRVTETASMTGENVGFYLRGNATTLRFDSDTTIDLSAPLQGEMAGLLLFEDRSGPLLRTHRIASNNARRLIGTIYLSRGRLRIDATSPVADQSAYTAIVVRSLELDEGPNLVLRSEFDATDVPVPAGLITGRVVLSE
jgi:Flp pilus assembly protein TadG